MEGMANAATHKKASKKQPKLVQTLDGWTQEEHNFTTVYHNFHTARTHLRSSPPAKVEKIAAVIGNNTYGNTNNSHNTIRERDIHTIHLSTHVHVGRYPLCTYGQRVPMASSTQPKPQ